MPLTAPLHSHSSALSICRMGTAERLVVMSFRLWALPSAHPEYSHPDWIVGFRALGLEHTGFALFNPLLDTIFSSSQRVIEIHQLKCCSVTSDEALFLRCLSFYQHQKADQAEAILAAWLPTPATRVAASLASRFAAALDAAQLMLPLHETHAQSHRLLGRVVASGAGPGLTLIH